MAVATLDGDAEIVVVIVQPWAMALNSMQCLLSVGLDLVLYI